MLLQIMVFSAIALATGFAGNFTLKTTPCPPEQIFNTCGPSCSPTCQTYYRGLYREACPRGCVSSCYCRPGYIKANLEGDCIPSNECKRACRENEEFKSCGSGCPDTCQYKNVACPKRCVAGCFCKDGYVLDFEKDICVPKDKCTKAGC